VVFLFSILAVVVLVWWASAFREAMWRRDVMRELENTFGGMTLLRLHEATGIDLYHLQPIVEQLVQEKRVYLDLQNRYRIMEEASDPLQPYDPSL
jgi:hypothetical protein